MEELAALVQSAHSGEDPQGSNLPLDVLSGETASDSGLLLAMEYLCRRCGIEAVMAWGAGPRPNWLIVSTPVGYRHLTVDSLYAPAKEPEAEDPDSDGPDDEPDAEEPKPFFALYTDREMIGLGYRWQAELYPVCEEPKPS